MSTTPEPPEGFQIIPKDWFDEYTICPSDMLYWSAKEDKWLHSDFAGLLYEGFTDIYCTAEPLPTRTQSDPGWFPIDSAPKDGTEVLGWSPDWVDDEFNPDGIRSCIHDGESWNSARWCDDDFSILHRCDGDPVKWMPLPPPPTH